MTEYDEDDVYAEAEDDDDVELDTEVSYPEIGATYVVEALVVKYEKKVSERYPEGQGIVSVTWIIKEDEEFEGTRLFSNWYMGTKDDPNNIAREDANQAYYALTGERVGPGSPLRPKAMQGRTCTVQIASAEYKKDGETMGSGVRPKLKSWKQYEG